MPRSGEYAGRSCAGGEPAYKVLAEEIEMLGGIGERDLLAEIEGKELE